jgi:hypothetical protein
MYGSSKTPATGFTRLTRHLLLQRLALQLWLWSVLLLLLPSLVHSCHITISSRLLPGGLEQWRPWQLGSLLVDVLLLGEGFQRRHLESSSFRNNVFGRLYNRNSVNFMEF